VERPSGAVEPGEEAVSGGVDLGPAIAFEDATDDGVVSLEEVRPCCVAHSRRVFGRRDDVGHQDGDQDARPARDRGELRGHLPVEGPHVIGVSAVGPSGRKSDYSNYGVEQISVAAPGGFYRDGFGTPTFNTFGNTILSTYPLHVLQEEGMVNEDGTIVPDFANQVVQYCDAAGRCGYYRYLQGTSMAAPHASGVAALIVSRYGQPDRRHRGTLGLDPAVVESVLTRTAAERACPEPRLQSYANEGRPAEFDALCVGDLEFNGFYGHGIVDAYAAVTARRR